MSERATNLSDALFPPDTVSFDWVATQFQMTDAETNDLLIANGVPIRWDDTYDREDVERALSAELERRKAEIRAEWTSTEFARRRRRMQIVEDVTGDA